MGATAPVSSIGRGDRLNGDLNSDPVGVRAAQALRYRVFGVEMGAKLKGHEPGLDFDELDPAYPRHFVERAARS